MVKIQKQSKNKKVITLAIIALLLIGLGVFAYMKQKSNNSKPVTQSGSAETINLQPATAEDKQRADQNKQAILEREKQLQNQPPTPGKKAVKPVITYAGQYDQAVEVGAYVPGVFEDDGTCNAVFTNGSKSFSKSVTAVKNVNSVDCPVMSANSSEFNPKGTWTVQVTYNSPSASGSSDNKQVEVK